MRPFKFLQDNGIPNHVHYLREYHRRLDDIYVRRFNFPYDSEEYGKTVEIMETVIGFIDNGNLTSFQEIRNYYRIFFLTSLNLEYGIGDEAHEDLMLEAYEHFNIEPEPRVINVYIQPEVPPEFIELSFNIVPNSESES